MGCARAEKLSGIGNEFYTNRNNIENRKVGQSRKNNENAGQANILKGRDDKKRTKKAADNCGCVLYNFFFLSKFRKLKLSCYPSSRRFRFCRAL